MQFGLNVHIRSTAAGLGVVAAGVIAANAAGRAAAVLVTIEAADFAVTALMEREERGMNM